MMTSISKFWHLFIKLQRASTDTGKQQMRIGKFVVRRTSVDYVLSPRG
jgi:hypothetical protein